VVSWLPGLAYDALEQHYRLGPRCAHAAATRILTLGRCHARYGLPVRDTLRRQLLSTPVLSVKNFSYEIYHKVYQPKALWRRVTILVGLLLHSAGHCGLWMVATRRLVLEYWQVLPGRDPQFSLFGSSTSASPEAASTSSSAQIETNATADHLHFPRDAPLHQPLRVQADSGGTLLSGRWWASRSSRLRAAAGPTPRAWRPTSGTSPASAASLWVRDGPKSAMLRAAAAAEYK